MELTVLPTEVAQIAENVSVEKRNEVQAVLNHVFNGVSKMREQLDSVVVIDENDKVNMKLANTIRLGVKQVRLEAEKTFDAKRTEVQQQMLSYKTEDSLWLKAKQTMIILTKEIEENARWKEETKERIEKEKKELKIQERILKVAKFNSEISRVEFENMSDETFETFIAGIEKSFNDKIEAEKKAEQERIEKEKKQVLFNERRLELAQYMQFYNSKNPDFIALTIETTEQEFIFILNNCKKLKLEYEAKQEEIRIENERLRLEAEAKEKALLIERERAEKARKEAELKALKEKELADKKLTEEKAKADLEAKKLKAENDAKLEAERKEREKLEAELKAKQLAELKAKQEVEAKEKAEIEAKKKAAKAPDKDKLKIWVDSFKLDSLPNLSSEESKTISLEIVNKFNSFTKWAESLINNL